MVESLEQALRAYQNFVEEILKDAKPDEETGKFVVGLDFSGLGIRPWIKPKEFEDCNSKPHTFTEIGLIAKSIEEKGYRNVRYKWGSKLERAYFPPNVIQLSFIRVIQLSFTR